MSEIFKVLSSGDGALPKDEQKQDIKAEPIQDLLSGAAQMRVEQKPTRAPNFMASRRVLPDLIEAAIAKDIKVILTKAGYELDGFYKFGPVRLEPGEDGGLVAIDRKGKGFPLKTFDDIVRLNYDCWKKSRDKGAAYINPGKEWQDEFSRMNLVKRQVIFVPGEE